MGELCLMGIFVVLLVIALELFWMGFRLRRRRGKRQKQKELALLRKGVGVYGRREQLMEFLYAQGPMTRREIVEFQKIPLGTLGGVLSDRRLFTRGPDKQWGLTDEAGNIMREREAIDAMAKEEMGE